MLRSSGSLFFLAASPPKPYLYIMARHWLSFGTNFVTRRASGKRTEVSAEPPVDTELRAMIEESLADPRPNLSAEDVHDRLARRHEARLKRAP